ncbi:MAG: hypothetical protein KIT84_21750 [Labilithrix sp.]|nr:hypothetical protein [Labilithrix sp.]MCW5813669.1 hypothetical protein [Labilithrix sp.]
MGVVLGVGACGEVDPEGDLSEQIAAVANTNDGATCTEPNDGQDPKILKVCTGTKGSKGRCVPDLFLTGDNAGKFEAADCPKEMSCVPEEVVAKGSKIELKKCESVLGVEGRCFWPLAKEILGNYDQLKAATKDQCEGEQVCAPCGHPVTGKATGICLLGAAHECKGPKKPAARTGKCPQDEPILEESGFKQEECSSNMLCVDAALVEGPQAAKLAKCKTGLCAPKKSVLRAGGYVPKTCKSLGGAEGRCVNAGVPEIGAQKDLLPVADCDADERCAPCFDPRTGVDTGSCSQVPCDKPKEPAKLFAPCCEGKGRCVPTAAAGSAASSLGPATCSGETPLCAPNEFVGISKPRACKARLSGNGVCLSRCIITKGGIFAGLIQGSCEDEELCAPCKQLPPGTEGCQ